MRGVQGFAERAVQDFEAARDPAGQRDRTALGALSASLAALLCIIGVAGS